MQRHTTTAMDRSKEAARQLALAILVALAFLSTAYANHPAPQQPESTLAPCPLDLSLVDLTTAAEIDQLDTDDETSSAAPVLNLGPRVATIVRDVFGDSSDSKISEESPPSVEPVASAPKKNSEPKADDGEPVEQPGSAYSPLKIHREMYRTDI